MYKVIKVIMLAIVVSFASTTAFAKDHPAQELVVDAINAMLDVYRSEGDRLSSEPAYLQAKLDELIVPNLDFDTMTKLAVGKFWRKADGQQRKELVKEFKVLLLNTYSSALTQYSGEAISFEPFREEKRDHRAVVRSMFTQSGGSNVPVVYKLRDKDGWRIYDIEVNNISLVTSYRSAFSNEIDKGGIVGLLESLKEKNGTS